MSLRAAASGMTLRRLLVALAALLVGINVVSALWDIRKERMAVERNTLRDFNNITAVLADQTARSLESVGLLLRAAATEIADSGVGDPRARTQRLADRISGIPQVRGLLLLDPQGKVVLSTDPRSELGADFSSRSYFGRLRDGSAKAPFVSEPFRGRLSGRWAFAVSQPITDARGRFAGVLAAIIDVEYVDRLYRSLDIGEGFVALLTLDGILVTRVPPDQDHFGKRLPDRGGVLAAVAQDGRYTGWAAGMTMPTRVLISAARVADTQLLVSVGAPEEAVLAPWHAESSKIVVRTLLTSLVMMVLVAVAARELARRARADEIAKAEQQRLQDRLRQAEKMEAIGRLAGGIAHDFNNILGGILGYGEMLEESAAEGSPERRYARNLLVAAHRARDLVDQILAYSRSQRASRDPVDIGRIVVETLDVVRGSLPAGIALEPDLPADSLIVRGDATQLHQVIMNLCTNAIHAMNGTGTLRVATEAIDLVQELKVPHAALPAGPYVKLSVTDTGTGMDDATMVRIFEPFFTTKEVGHGTGLGLSLVYGIVADSGGGTHVTSRVGHGSTFEIYLPRLDTAELAAAPAEHPIARGRGQRVLLVDDEKPLLIMTAELLSRLGYDPAPFSDPHSALASLQAMPKAYDVVLTDETMPGMSGTALASAARHARPDLPVLLISGHTNAALVEAAVRSGVREVLKKPVESRELSAALARVLDA